MTSKQKKILLIIFAIGLAYFVILFLPNNTGAQNEEMLGWLSHDETITYPYVLHMLAPSQNIHELWGNLIIYGDYHYGYPFYLISMLVVLPVKLIYGAQFQSYTQLSLLLLREFVSVLPMIIAIGFLTFLMTRFQHWFRSIGLFIFILTIPAVVRQNLVWWHPDALTVLAAVLTLFFLDLDHLRFKRYFYLAAFTCGLAAAIKLLGVFFFLTIMVYLVVGIVKHYVSIRKAAVYGTVFVAIMAATIILTNPFLFYQTQREQLIHIQQEKSVELASGYTHDFQYYYRIGPKFWKWTLETWYAPIPFLLFLAASNIAGCIWGSGKFTNRLFLSWMVPYSIYLLFFVAPKPDHYWLPVMLPLFACAFNLLDIFASKSPMPASENRFKVILQWGITAAVILIVGYQFKQFLFMDYANYIETLFQELRLKQ
jgi:hypothetical protein